jgi:hypothetical protein
MSDATADAYEYTPHPMRKYELSWRDGNDTTVTLTFRALGDDAARAYVQATIQQLVDGNWSLTEPTTRQIAQPL